MQHRATLCAQVLPNIALHSQMLVEDTGELAWVVRQDNPELKKLLDEFIDQHGEGSSFGNILLADICRKTNG